MRVLACLALIGGAAAQDGALIELDGDRGVMTPGDALRERVAGPRISTWALAEAALCRPFPRTCE